MHRLQSLEGLNSIETNDWTRSARRTIFKAPTPPTDPIQPTIELPAAGSRQKASASMERILFAVFVSFLLTGCAMYRDTRTQTDLDRDAEIWTRAHGLQVAMSPDQLKECSSLGVVSERYYEGPPGDPAKRPMGATWPEYVLRFKTAELGGNAALASASIKKWTGQLNERRVLGEAYLCNEPTVITASQGFSK